MARIVVKIRCVRRRTLILAEVCLHRPALIGVEDLRPTIEAPGLLDRLDARLHTKGDRQRDQHGRNMARQRVCRAVLRTVTVYLKADESVAEARGSISRPTAAVFTPRLTGARPIKPTTPRCHSAWQPKGATPNPGRSSTYRRGNSVPTTVRPG